MLNVELVLPIIDGHNLLSIRPQDSRNIRMHNVHCTSFALFATIVLKRTTPPEREHPKEVRTNHSMAISDQRSIFAPRTSAARVVDGAEWPGRSSISEIDSQSNEIEKSMK